MVNQTNVDSLDAWRKLRQPGSKWKRRARAVIRDVVDMLAESAPQILADPKEALVRIDAAYPFGERKYEPYKCWLAERRLVIDALTPMPEPSADEVGVCEVAGDMVDIGRIDEARKLIQDQAPNRLNRECPVCGRRRGRPCEGLGTGLDLLVPHLERLGVYRDHGPLFQGPQ